MKDIKNYINESQVNESLSSALLTLLITSGLYTFVLWYSNKYLENHINKIYDAISNKYNEFKYWLDEEKRGDILVKVAKDPEYKKFIEENPIDDSTDLMEWKRMYLFMLKQKLQPKDYKLLTNIKVTIAK